MIFAEQSLIDRNRWCVLAGRKRELVADFYGPYAEWRAKFVARFLENERRRARRQGVVSDGGCALKIAEEPIIRSHPKHYDRQRHGFRITCLYCDMDHVESIPEAKREGWTKIDILDDFRDAPWTHIGVCPYPGCKAEEDGSAAEKRRQQWVIEQAVIAGTIY